MEKESCDKKDSTNLIRVRLATLLMLALEMVRGSPCTVTPQYANCNTHSIVNIPQDLPSNITSLYLDGNLIETIKARDFQHLGQLEYVHINNNRIEWVDVEAFAHLTQLLKVYLSDNRITNVINTMFIKNTKLTDLWLNGNKLHIDPASPLLISSSIEYLQLRNCGIWQISSATFSRMQNLHFLFISQNNILSLDVSSFNYNSLQELHIDPAEEIQSTLSEICNKNVTVNVHYNLNVQSFCKGNWTSDTTIMRPYLTSPKEMPTATTIDFFPTTATPKETVSTHRRAESTAECDKKTVSLDRILVWVSLSLALATSGLSLAVLLFYWRKQKSKTKKCSENPLQNDKPEVYTHSEDQCPLYDGYEEPRRDALVVAQRPLLHPPLYTSQCSLHSYHEYEIINYQ